MTKPSILIFSRSKMLRQKLKKQSAISNSFLKKTTRSTPDKETNWPYSFDGL